MTAARVDKRTEQGGPPNGDRKRGTGGVLAVFKPEDIGRRKDTEGGLEDGRVARSLDAAGEPGGRM